MSRIGKKPIKIPESVEVEIKDKKVTIKGPKGELIKEIRPEIIIEIKEGKIFVLPKSSATFQKKGLGEGITGKIKESKKTKAFWGLTRTLIFNMIKGVIEGYEKKLQIEGLGYKANLEGEDLILDVGFSHPVKIKKPEGIKFSVEKNIITIVGINKEKVGETAAKIRKIKPPEPYKGKGIRYVGEQVRKKVGKKVATVTE